MVRPAKFGIIERRVAASTGEYLWKVPQDFPRGEYLKICVTDTLNDSIEDQSYAFQILPGAPRPAHETASLGAAGGASRFNSSSGGGGGGGSDGQNSWQLDAFNSAMREGARSADTTAEQDLLNAFTKIGSDASRFLINKYGAGDERAASQYLLRKFVEEMAPHQTAQRNRSRRFRIDDFSAWPPPGLTRNVSPESEANAEGFVTKHEVEIRRICQLSSARFTLNTRRVQFCSGGSEAEKTHVLTRLCSKWEEGGWELTNAVQDLWAGSRNEVSLCEATDAASKVVVRALLRTIKNMERRYLAGQDTHALNFAASIEQLYNVGHASIDSVFAAMETVFANAFATKCTLLSSAGFAGGPARTTLQQAYFGSLAAAGLQVTESSSSSTKPGHVDCNVVCTGNVTRESLERSTAIVRYECNPGNFEQLLSALLRGNNPAAAAPPVPPPMVGTGGADEWGSSNPIDVYEPHDGSVFYPGEVCTVKWTVKPGTDIAAVRLLCYKQAPELDKLEFVGRPHGIIIHRVGNDGTYKWVIPFDFPCSVRVALRAVYACIQLDAHQSLEHVTLIFFLLRRKMAAFAFVLPRLCFISSPIHHALFLLFFFRLCVC